MGFPNPIDAARKAKEAAQRKLEEAKRAVEKKAEEIKRKVEDKAGEIKEQAGQVKDKVETLVDKLPTPGEVIDDGVKKVANDKDIERQVNALNSNGDTANIKLTTEGGGAVNLRGVNVGLKATNGSEVKITQNGDGPDATYTLRYDKQNKGELNGELGSSSAGKGDGGKLSKAGANVTADVGGGSFDTVEMTFKSKEDAIRAGKIAARLQIADGLDDALDQSPAIQAAGANPLVRQLPGVDGLLNGGTPLGNPLHPDGAPGSTLTDAVGVSESDIDFLKKNVTAYEQSVSLTVGLGGDISIPKIPGNKIPGIGEDVPGIGDKLSLAVAGRVEGETKYTRRVELPTETKDGTVTYSVEGNSRLTATEKASLADKLAPRLPGASTIDKDSTVSLGLNNRQSVGSATTKVSFSYSIPAGETPTDSFSGRPVPETSSNTPLKFKEASVETRAELRDQGVTDLSRTDTRYASTKLTLTDPGRVPQAIGQLAKGDFEEAARTSGASLELTARNIDRDGYDLQVPLGVDLKVAKVGVGVNIARGVDDVTETKILFKPGEEPKPVEPTKTEPEKPEKPGTPESKTVAVVPFNGANIRETPGGKDIGDIQSGSFLRTQGEPKKTEDGKSWVQVSGTDEADKPVKGWVRSDLLVDHSAEKGAMDKTGRINPTNERDGYSQITVKQRDNLWNIAQEHGWDYKETLAANKDHILNPALIFKGDTVYVPGTARTPEG